MAVLDREEMARRTGTTAYPGGVIDRRGGVLHPLNHALGLAAAAGARGAHIHGDSPAQDSRRDGARHVVTTPPGSVRAETVLICTNACSGDLMRRLARSVLPVRSVQVATAPLSDNLRRTVLPEGNALSDTRRLLDRLGL